jgi:iron complex outermembrane receptor protein
LAAIVVSLFAGGVFGVARAEPERRQFAIPAQPYSEALIAFAVQADITLGGAKSCVGRSRGLKGRYTVEQGLKKLLNGAPCRFQLLDARTVRILAGGSRPARAEPAREPAPVDPTDATRVTEVVVTATKRASASGRIPAAISVLGGERMRLVGVNDASDAVDQIAGVTMTNLGPGRDKILLRGLSDGAFTGRTQSTVGTYLDDLPINYNAPDPDLRLVDVERIEVVRGPQGALYGGGSLAGVYRIVTRRPDLDGYSGYLQGSAGWTEAGAPSYAVEGMVNLPVVSDRLGVRVVAYHELQGGYLDDVNLRLSNVDQTVREGGRVAIEARLNSDWTVTANAVVQHLASADTQYVTSPTVSRRRANRVREDHENNFGQGSITIVGVGDWGRFESSTGYLHHTFSSQYDASAALSVFGASDMDLGVYEEASAIDMLVEDAVWTSPDEGRLRWLVGVYGSSTVESSPSALRARGTSGPPRLLYQEERRDRLQEGAIYGEASYDIVPGWTVTVGGRAFRTSLLTRSDIDAPAPGRSRSLDESKDFYGVSPKFSLQHDLPSGGLIYFLASEGYRAGGFNSGGLLPPVAARASFSPDRLQNYEVGAKLKLLDGKLNVRVAGFYDRWSDIQTDQYFGSGLSYTANVGDGRNIGVEGEAEWRPAPHFTLQANALFDAPELTHVLPNFTAQARGGLPGVPNASFGALAIYDHPLRDRLSLLMTAEAGYIGRSRLTFDPLLSPTMGGYFSTKLSLQLVTPRWRLAGFVSNAANTAGDTFAYGNPFSFGQVRQVTPQRPRTLNLVLTRSF